MKPRSSLVSPPALGLVCLALCGCPAAPSDPPPPPRKAELVAAPPNARGARAAGTDAAPKPELGVLLGEGMPAVPETEPPPDGGAPDASPPGVAPSPPDGGTAL